VLSLNSPGIQAEPEAAVAVRAALAVNDLLASVIGDHPDRFRGFAAPPLQDRAAAADELERAVTQLGLAGGLVNAHINGEYLDDPDFSVVWERAAGLGVPIYLHPANSGGHGPRAVRPPRAGGPDVELGRRHLDPRPAAGMARSLAKA